MRWHESKEGGKLSWGLRGKLLPSSCSASLLGTKTKLEKMEAVADLLYDLPKNYGLAFDVVHYIVCLQAERTDLGDGFEKITRNNPLVSDVLPPLVHCMMS